MFTNSEEKEKLRERVRRGGGRGGAGEGATGDSERTVSAESR